MFLNQPGALKFGDHLIQELGDTRWTTFDLAVAWVRQSGAEELNDAVRAFLSRGGRIRATVGIDLQNTSIEGLRALLAWQNEGEVELFVYHDENLAVTFHPKVYLLGNGERGRLFVGSNNLTGSGLAANSEASLMIESSLSDPTMVEAENALAQWRDESSDLVLLLNTELLDQLVKADYVRSERELQRRRSNDLKHDGGSARAVVRLFGRTKGRGSRTRSTPSEGAMPGAHAPRHPAPGQTLLMRIRPARGGTQVQLPKKLRDSPFFKSAGTIVSAHSGQMHTINPARARGMINTLKLEIPEAAGMHEPLLRFRWIAGSLQYEVFESTSPDGLTIKFELESGLVMRPPQTQASKSNLNVAQWWRFT